MKTSSEQFFVNKGFGWTCSSCEKASVKLTDAEGSRLLKEGEAESKNPRLSNTTLAVWSDESKQFLICPKCEASDRIK